MKDRLFTILAALSLLICAIPTTLWIRAALAGEYVSLRTSPTEADAWVLGQGYISHESLTDPTGALISAMKTLHTQRPSAMARTGTVSRVDHSIGHVLLIESLEVRLFRFSGKLHIVSVAYLPLILLSAIVPLVWIYGKLRRPADPSKSPT